MKALVSLGLAIVISLTVGCNRETGHAAGESNTDMQQRIQSRLNTDAELMAAKLTVEADAANNQTQRLVHVRKEQIRVLLLQSYPNYEFRYLKQMLHWPGPGAEIGMFEACQFVSRMNNA